MNKLLVVVIGLLFAISAQAQHATVVYNYERNFFNENQPLPAETPFILSGGVADDISMVVFEILKSNKDKQLHEAAWKRPEGSALGAFNLPVNYKLHGNSKHDFRLTYYRNLSAAEREYLKVRLFQTLDTYLNSSMEVGRKSIKLSSPVRQIMSDLNSIVNDGLSIYRNNTGLTFEGFSDVTKSAIEQIEKAKLKQGKTIFGKKGKASKALYVAQLKKDAAKIVHNEVEQYLNSDLMTISDTKFVDDYSVARGKGGLPLNIGYGATFFGGDFDDLDYDSAPYIGVSLPFGRSAFSKFLGNASLSAGIFINNLENNDGETVTGPIVGRPIYAALGYRLFKFIRLNVGATLIETEISSSSSELGVRPFVGLAAEINLSARIGD